MIPASLRSIGLVPSVSRCRRWAGLLMLLLTLPSAAADVTRPTRSDVSKLREQGANTLLHVEGPEAAGPGVLVGRRGEVLTAVGHVGLARARILYREAPLEGRVLYANAQTGMALVRADAPSKLEMPVPIRPLEAFEPGRWIIALTRDRSGAIEATPLQWIEPPPRPDRPSGPRGALRAKLPLGTPLFDARGRLVAIVTEERRGISSAMSISVMQRVVASGALE